MLQLFRHHHHHNRKREVGGETHRAVHNSKTKFSCLIAMYKETFSKTSWSFGPVGCIYVQSQRDSRVVMRYYQRMQNRKHFIRFSMTVKSEHLLHFHHLLTRS